MIHLAGDEAQEAAILNPYEMAQQKKIWNAGQQPVMQLPSIQDQLIQQDSNLTYLNLNPLSIGLFDNIKHFSSIASFLQLLLIFLYSGMDGTCEDDYYEEESEDEDEECMMGSDDAED